MGCTFSYSEDPRFTITSPLFFLCWGQGHLQKRDGTAIIDNQSHSAQLIETNEKVFRKSCVGVVSTDIAKVLASRFRRLFDLLQFGGDHIDLLGLALQLAEIDLHVEDARQHSKDCLGTFRIDEIT
jgi:hypothetical protein